MNQTLPRSRYSWDEKSISQLRQSYLSGITLKHIAHDLGTSVLSIRNKIHELRKLDPVAWPRRRTTTKLKALMLRIPPAHYDHLAKQARFNRMHTAMYIKRLIAADVIKHGGG